MAEARAAVAHLQGRLLRSTMTPDMDENSSADAAITWLVELFCQVVETSGAVRQAAPRFGADLAAFTLQVHALLPKPGESKVWTPDRRRSRDLASVLLGKLVEWQGDPAKQEKREGPPVDRGAELDALQAKKAERRRARHAASSSDPE